ARYQTHTRETPETVGDRVRGRVPDRGQDRGDQGDRDNSAGHRGGDSKGSSHRKAPRRRSRPETGTSNTEPSGLLSRQVSTGPDGSGAAVAPLGPGPHRPGCGSGGGQQAEP